MKTEKKEIFDWDLNPCHAKPALLGQVVKRQFSVKSNKLQACDPHLVLQTEKTQNECKQILWTGYGEEKKEKRTL